MSRVSCKASVSKVSPSVFGSAAGSTGKSGAVSPPSFCNLESIPESILGKTPLAADLELSMTRFERRERRRVRLSLEVLICCPPRSITWSHGN